MGSWDTRWRPAVEVGGNCFQLLHPLPPTLQLFNLWLHQSDMLDILVHWSAIKSSIHVVQLGLQTSHRRRMLMNATTCLCHPCQGFGRNENEFALELANIKPYDEKVNFEAKFHITQHHKSTNRSFIMSNVARKSVLKSKNLCSFLQVAPAPNSSHDQRVEMRKHNSSRRLQHIIYILIASYSRY